MTVLWWIRRDLRLKDNQALSAAAADGKPIVPVFILDQAILKADTYSDQRMAFLLDGLRALESDIQERGGRLIVKRGKPAAVLQKLVAETNATAIFAERDITPYATKRDEAVAKSLPLTLCAGLTVRHPTAVTKKAGGYYTVFTPFKRAWQALVLPRQQDFAQPPDKFDTPAHLISEPLPETPGREATVPFIAGEAEAHKRLSQFLKSRIYRYNDERDLMGNNGTSTLSPYLRFGMLSARQAIVAAIEARTKGASVAEREGADVWLSELIWREFYQQILFHYPHVRRGSFRPIYDQIEWRNNEDDFSAWCHGRTGYPVVDAAMRQLKQSGWMHNRARMIVASFLTKDLLIDWRWGEKWFMQRLVDGDLAANNGGWQWAAGTGTDAAPYFRIFNPTSQGKKFDPDGAYVKRWVPELANLPSKFIHEPWKMGPMEEKLYNCVLGEDYPHQIVDHKWARQETLAAYKKAREVG